MKFETRMKKLPEELESQFPEEIQIFRRFIFENFTEDNPEDDILQEDNH
tara:strand:- start:4167 stop:4313 length:147 start_codon:yes stop_codon:yes gene_type:complete